MNPLAPSNLPTGGGDDNNNLGVVSNEECESLPASERSLMKEMDERFLCVPAFRTIVQEVLNLRRIQPEFGHHSVIVSLSPAPFPLVKLPVELRLMIAEYALSSNEGLPYHPTQYLSPTQTLNLWPRFNTLHFDGRSAPPIASLQFEKAVEDYDYFLKSRTTSNLVQNPNLTFKIDSDQNGSIGMRKLCQIIYLGHHAGIRVVNMHSVTPYSLTFFSRTLGAARHFSKMKETCEQRIQRAEADFPKRIWKLHAVAPSQKSVHSLRKYHSPEDLSAALDFIENGV
ncbi:hypothetical protein CC86DRAFT_471099 [Ophiobolus disseminans]|uniref:Uncharacterized protein n=1 Tax=Ophiobolus disseminans TaxID=1469910 RepID=A0A6A6ZHI6_9PLEO|nr:hypothetical protein CC86DRAFT_471099 [Ophiobolus disseminans]